MADGRIEIRHRSLYPEKGKLTDVDDLPRPTARTPRSSTTSRYLRDRPDSIVGALEDIADRGRAGARALRGGQGPHGRGRRAWRWPRWAWSATAIVADYVATGERITEIMDPAARSATYAADLEAYTDDSAHAARRVSSSACSRSSTSATAARRAGSRRTGSTRAPLRERLIA